MPPKYSFVGEYFAAGRACVRRAMWEVQFIKWDGKATGSSGSHLQTVRKDVVNT